MILVGHVRKDEGGEGATRIYCGRPSPLGNPFVMRSEEDRLLVIEKYDEWLTEAIRERNREVCDSLNYIYKKAKEGVVVLLCHCWPKACHCDVIKKVVDAKIEERKNAVR